jgi:hypothetical protein
MARRYVTPELTEDQIEGLRLEKEIINKIGYNKTNEKILVNELDLIEENGLQTKTFSLYTYQGQVCILDNQGMDVNFGCYQLRSQKRIHKEIMEGRYK